MEDEKVKVPFVEHPALTSFFQRFPPVSSFTEANLFLTTSDILQQLNENDPSFVTGIADMHIWLVKSGYTQAPLEGLKMVWLLSEI